MLRRPRSIALLAAASLALLACSGDDAATTTTAAPDDTSPGDAGQGDTTTAPDDTGPVDDGDLTPGPIGFRVVNLLDEPVDVYVRTIGLVRAELSAEVAPGDVTERIAPPSEGRLVVTAAGAGDPECVGTCPHFIAEASTFPDEGPLRTVVLYEDETGTPRGFDVWEDPGADRMNSANSMQRADPETGFLVTLAVALRDAQFGQGLSFAGVEGCQESFNLAGILVGGNQTPAFAYEGSSVEVFLHDNQDRECAEEPTGGPFTITGGPGTRALLILTGTPGDMDAVVLPIGADEMPEPDTGDELAGVDPGLLDELITDFVASTGVPPDDARCVITELVGELGIDFFYTSEGNLRGDDEISDDDIATLETALDPALVACGIGG